VLPPVAQRAWAYVPDQRTPGSRDSLCYRSAGPWSGPDEWLMFHRRLPRHYETLPAPPARTQSPGATRHHRIQRLSRMEHREGTTSQRSPAGGEERADQTVPRPSAHDEGHARAGVSEAVYRCWWAEHRVDGVLVVDPRAGDPRPGLLDGLGLPAVVTGGAPVLPPGRPVGATLTDGLSTYRARRCTVLSTRLHTHG
jgi:hypothetical protein